MRITVAISVLPFGAIALPQAYLEGSLHPTLKEHRSLSLNQIIDLVAQLFPVNIAIADATDLISTAEGTLATLAGIQTTENELPDSQCPDVAVVFARGTSEAGNVGAIAGPPLFSAITSLIGSSKTLAVQGIDYPASVAGFLAGGDQEGSEQMANLITNTTSICPMTKVVMSGYSQGGQLVHNAAKQLSADVLDAVSSVVIFGDPDSNQPVDGIDPSKVLVICHAGDDICDQGDLVLLPHLTYAEDANQAASFIASKAGL